MPDLHGFEVVGELTVAVLNNVLLGAWDNGKIPHSTPIAANTPVGPYHVHDGTVNIPRTGCSLVMDVPANGVRVTLQAEIQAQIADPPVESARFFDIFADISVSVPIGVLPDDSKKVAALLNNIPRSAVSAVITSGNPIPALTTSGVEEYVHKQYHDGVIKDHYAQPGASFGGFSADAWVDVYDDASKPNHHITVVAVDSTHVKVLIPIHLKLSNITGAGAALSPMGVVAKIALTTPLTQTPGFIKAPIKTSGVVTLEGFAAAPAVDPEVGDYDGQGAHYSTALGFFPALENALKTQITSRAQEIANAIGDITIVVPTQADLEGFIANEAHKAVINHGDIGLWTPNPPPGGDVSLRNVKPQALSDAIAFCINDSPGAASTAIANFIPSGFSCGIAISAAKVIEIVQQQIHKPESEGGFGTDFPNTPHHENAGGHDAKVTKLDVSLRTGSIHVEGDVTVVDAIADSIDVDASFEAEIGLQFEDNPDGSGTQLVKPFTISEDVDLSLLAWILSFLTGFITFGIVGGIIALVIMAVVEGIAEKVGGTIIRDEVTGRIKGIGAWPQSLDGIGEVHARFENPILIDPSGILFADAYHVVATFASTTDALADANGPYSVPEGAEVEFDGLPIKPNTTYSWDLGDGAVLPGAVVTHRYADNGLYVAKLTTVVNEKGGVTTRHFAAVRVTNVAATVDAGPPITIDEGQVTEFTATFTDPGWPDTHTAIFDFGDDSSPVVGSMTETHAAPMGKGTTQASHAYCDNGTYTVTVRVIDDDGGVGVGTKIVTVRNVPPTVHAGPDMFAYACTPITLVGHFTDPGWCDTHTATWDFGDCTPPLPATVRERHEPPEGCGIAAATHRYDKCGHFYAICTVTDDDGGVGQDAMIVRVVDVVNGGFEDGFRTRALGIVGNGWEAYADGPSDPAVAAGTTRLEPDQFVVHGDGLRGQRSQRVEGTGSYRAGIYQSVGANLSWDYQVSAWFHAREPGTICSLGIDPAGGTDANATSVVWMNTNDVTEWTQLAVRCTATARAVTIFLEIDSEQLAGDSSSWFDDVELLPYPCPLGDAPPCKPPQDESTCVDWKDEVRPRVVTSPYTKNGFVFTSPGEPLHIVMWGPPLGQMKLALPKRLLQIQLPFAADRVVAHVWAGTQQKIGMEALSAANIALGVATSSGVSSAATPEMLEIRAAGIAALVLVGGGGEGTLVDLCIYKGDDRSPNDPHDGVVTVVGQPPTSVTPAGGGDKPKPTGNPAVGVLQGGGAVSGRPVRGAPVTGSTKMSGDCGCG
ncbi:MAG: PKD domain-containing protein [Gemmatimonadota bacterium]|nr:PKD domain-containing protein [Gemmatimonadota bacterium]